MSATEQLYACPICKRAGFTARGLRAHFCHGYSGKSKQLPRQMVAAVLEEQSARPSAASAALRETSGKEETTELPVFIVNGMTRKECMDGLRSLRDSAVELQRQSMSDFVRWPDVDALIDHIDKYGFPIPEISRGGAENAEKEGK